MTDSNFDAEPTILSPDPRQAKCSAILESIGKHHLLHATTLEPGFVWNDFLIPYCSEQLPKEDNGSLDYAIHFMEEQKKFVSESSRESLGNILTRHSNEGEPPHLHYTSIGDEIQIGNPLGLGRWGEVSEVISQPENGRSKRFAMKRMRKPVPREGNGRPTCTVSEFEDEVRSLSRCFHHHIIDLRASFTDELNFGLIVAPVAESTLEGLLKGYTTENKIDENNAVQEALENAFGCLLNAIHYLHDELKIRHRDIKPRNILMHDHRVLICDLGSAYDFESRDRKESTDSKRPPGTGKYKAPEVWASIKPNAPQSHNKMADIFSLGCVFLEMHTVLCEETLDKMAQFITQKKTNDFEGTREDWVYALSLDRVYEWLDELCDDTRNAGRTDFIRNMVCSTSCSGRIVTMTINFLAF